jgi:hypothetical protein
MMKNFELNAKLGEPWVELGNQSELGGWGREEGSGRSEGR